jgi:hypothetical protein
LHRKPEFGDSKTIPTLRVASASDPELVDIAKPDGEILLLTLTGNSI